MLLLTVWRLLEVLLLRICRCWKSEHYMLFSREIVLGVMLMAVVLLISLAACLQLLSWKKSAGVLQEQDRHDVWLNQLLPQPWGGCSSTAHSVFISLGSLWFTEVLLAAFEVWNYLYDGPFCVKPCWSAPVKSLDTIFVLQVVAIEAGWIKPHKLQSLRGKMPSLLETAHSFYRQLR